VCDIVVKKFTFAISSLDEFSYSEVLFSMRVGTTETWRITDVWAFDD